VVALFAVCKNHRLVFINTKINYICSRVGKESGVKSECALSFFVSLKTCFSQSSCIEKIFAARQMALQVACPDPDTSCSNQQRHRSADAAHALVYICSFGYYVGASSEC